MSLTLWLTDYLFTPLSLTLRDYGQAGLIGAIFINMIVIGIWHGLTLNYLVFGILQAIFLSVTVVILGARTRRRRAAGKTINFSVQPGCRGTRSPSRRGADLRARELRNDLLPFPDLGPVDVRPCPDLRLAA